MKRVKNIHSFFSLILIFTYFFISCSIQKKNNIPEEQFIEILSDIMIIENLAASQVKKLELIKTILEKHDTTVENFTSTRDYYKDDAEFWIKVYKRVQERIKKQDSL
jgi:hypothetical protein